MKKRFTFILTFILAFTTFFSTSASAASYPTLRNGSKGTAVRYLQMNLNGTGYNCGNADGVFGNKTANAVKAFQKTHKLEPDGIAGKNTLSKMESIVKSVQANLNALGYNCGSADGVYGSKTANAVKSFQKAYGFTADGIATTSVQKKLAAAAAEKKSEKETSLHKADSSYRKAAESFAARIIDGTHPVAQLGDTYQKYTKWYYGKAKKVDWCAIWCSWALEQLDVEWKNAAGCGTFRERMKDAGAFHKISDNNYTPKTGDLILFSNNDGETHCHIGMVVMDGKTVQILHGNYNTGGVTGGGKLTLTKNIMKSDYLKTRMHAYCDMDAYISYKAG